MFPHPEMRRASLFVAAVFLQALGLPSGVYAQAYLGRGAAGARGGGGRPGTVRRSFSLACPHPLRLQPHLLEEARPPPPPPPPPPDPRPHPPPPPPRPPP